MITSKLFWYIFLILSISALAFCAYNLYRNEQVYDLRTEILDHIGSLINESELDTYTPEHFAIVTELLIDYNSMTYDEMMSMKYMFTSIDSIKMEWLNRMQYSTKITNFKELERKE